MGHSSVAGGRLVGWIGTGQIMFQPELFTQAVVTDAGPTDTYPSYKAYNNLP